MEAEGRILHRNWDQYDTRQVVYKTTGLSAQELKQGYDWAYRSFYSWGNIAKASLQHENVKHILKHFAYAGGWKKFEPAWNFLIKSKVLNTTLPVLEAVLSKVHNTRKGKQDVSPFPAIA
jgi:hypothetical protein